MSPSLGSEGVAGVVSSVAAKCAVHQPVMTVTVSGSSWDN